MDRPGGTSREALRLDSSAGVVAARRCGRCCRLCRRLINHGARGGRRCRRCRCLACAVGVCLLVVGIVIVNLWPDTRREDIGARATVYAKLAGASYCLANELTTWTCGPKCIPGVSNVHICQGDTTKAFVAWWEDRCVVSIMGTQAYVAMLRDLEFYKKSTSWASCTDCRVHDGFYSEWESLSTCVRGSLKQAGCPSGSRIRVTGHSMGGAITVLAMMSLADDGWSIEEAYTFGMPRTGNQNFAMKFQRRFGDVFYRVTHHMDPVVHVPPAELITDWHFQHVEPELFFDQGVSAGYRVCSKDNDERCSAMYASYLDIFHIGDHMVYMDILIGTPGCKQAGASGLQGPGWNASLH